MTPAGTKNKSKLWIINSITVHCPLWFPFLIRFTKGTPIRGDLSTIHFKIFRPIKKQVFLPTGFNDLENHFIFRGSDKSLHEPYLMCANRTNGVITICTSLLVLAQHRTNLRIIFCALNGEPNLSFKKVINNKKFMVRPLIVMSHLYYLSRLKIKRLATLYKEHFVLTGMVLFLALFVQKHFRLLKVHYPYNTRAPPFYPITDFRF
jgi:hypothetical protein